MEREYDLVLFGATGFTGRYAARYLRDHAPAGLRWCLAARNAEKLAAIAKEVNAPATMVADSGDPQSVDAMAASTRALITTVGPYLTYGTPVVEACVRHGTHYADITGETPWVRDLLDAFADAAKASGARVVPFCGFDSVPSDMGAYIMARHCTEVLGIGCTSVKAAFRSKGGINGGTLATMRTLAEKGRSRDVMDPFLLDPDETRNRTDKRDHYDPRSVQWDEDFDKYTTPFFMGAINTRVVRRSAALFGLENLGYGDRFAYQEYLVAKSRLQATTIVAGMGVVFGMAQRGFGRRLIARFGPDPGEGPSEESVDNGYVKVDLVARADDGTVLRGEFSGQGDPGNACTVRCLCEAGFLLAASEQSNARVGFLTPATAFGMDLVEALRGRGMTIAVHGA